MSPWTCRYCRRTNPGSEEVCLSCRAHIGILLWSKDEKQLHSMAVGLAWLFFLALSMAAIGAILNKFIRHFPSLQAHLHSLYVCRYEGPCGFYLFGIPLSVWALPWFAWPLADLVTIAIAPVLGPRQRIHDWLTRYRPRFLRRPYAWLLTLCYDNWDKNPGSMKDADIERDR
jgi:hypothetical protein